MKRVAGVYFNDRFAGTLIQEDDKTYTFSYDTVYLSDPYSEPVSITLPKQTESFKSEILFPFFAGLLSEGAQKELQLRFLGVAESDYFARLLYCASETVGAVTVREIK